MRRGQHDGHLRRGVRNGVSERWSRGAARSCAYRQVFTNSC